MYVEKDIQRIISSHADNVQNGELAGGYMVYKFSLWDADNEGIAERARRVCVEALNEASRS